MPGLNGTGPQGAEPLTGRGMGLCGKGHQTWHNHPLRNTRSSDGSGCRGRGCRRRNRFYTTGISRWTSPPPQHEIADLHAMVHQLKMQLNAIQKRIEELNS
jgi:hypothetical protein